MFNWWLVAALACAAIAGFFYLDKFFINFVQILRRNLPESATYVFQMLSYTPFVILALYLIPLGLIFNYLEFFSAATFTLACLLATGLAFIGKYLFKRVRPFGNTTYLGKIDSAFPSAHTAGSFAAAFTVGFFWPVCNTPILVLAALVAFSRIYLDLHFFSDVMGGILLGYLMASFAMESNIITVLGF